MGLRLCSLRLSAEGLTPAELARDSPGEHEARDRLCRFRAGALPANLKPKDYLPGASHYFSSFDPIQALD